jgi:MFS family permease
MISATFYAVVPSWMLANNFPQETIRLVMLSAVLGGLAFQVPVGLLSDRVDRRMLLGALAFGFAVTALVLVVLPRQLSLVLSVAALLGGFMSTLYPVCVSNAMDNMAQEGAVSISGRLILMSGIGSTLGPLTGAWIMGYLDLHGVLYFMAGVAVLLGTAATMKGLSRPSAPAVGAPFTVVAPQALHVVPEEEAGTNGAETPSTA